MFHASAETWLNLFPAPIRRILCQAAPESRAQWQEIRLRPGQPLLVISGAGETWLHSPAPGESQLLTPEDLESVLQHAAQYSVYAFEEELRRGYLTLPGGHRLGFSGRAILADGRIRLLRQICSLNLRLARAVKGAGEPVLPWLVSGGRFLSTLILSPPRCGKTTLLRDLVRLLSQGVPGIRLPGRQISLVDERSEIAGTYLGRPQLDVGPRTDVLDGAPKAEGMMLMIRAMSPEILATDEIGRPEDAEAIAEAAKAGVAVLATAHAADADEAGSRPILARLLAGDYFQRLVILDARKQPGTVRGILARTKNGGGEVESCSSSWEPCSSWPARAG